MNPKLLSGLLLSFLILSGCSSPPRVVPKPVIVEVPRLVPQKVDGRCLVLETCDLTVETNGELIEAALSCAEAVEILNSRLDCIRDQVEVIGEPIDADNDPR